MNTLIKSRKRKITFSVSFFSDVYFPATVICNINQASKAFLNTLELYSAPEATVLFNEFAQGNVSGWKQHGRYGEANPELNTTKYKDILTKTLKTLEKKYNYTQTTSFTSLAAPKCEDIMVYAHFKDTESRLFYKAYRSSTDYGVCCLVVPYLDFENPETRNVSPNDYTGENFLNVPRGAGIGARNGLKLILDIGKNKTVTEICRA